jgi:glucose dehydrogenase
MMARHFLARFGALLLIAVLIETACLWLLSRVSLDIEPSIPRHQIEVECAKVAVLLHFPGLLLFSTPLVNTPALVFSVLAAVGYVEIASILVLSKMFVGTVRRPRKYQRQQPK